MKNDEETYLFGSTRRKNTIGRALVVRSQAAVLTGHRLNWQRHLTRPEHGGHEPILHRTTRRRPLEPIAWELTGATSPSHLYQVEAICPFRRECR